MNEERRGKLRERRRQDVRDQADILHSLASTNSNVTFDPVNDAVRDFRVAEREGRQRRRRQARTNKNITRHCEGLSSDDEMPGQDEAQLGIVKKDVENQARYVFFIFRLRYKLKVTTKILINNINYTLRKLFL